MARTVKLTSGSVLNGNPITFTIQPNVIIGVDDDKNTIYPSFHRVIVEVICGISGGNYETIKMSVPVYEESNTTEIAIDISSALRTFRDTYEYSPLSATYPVVKFRLNVYDEYMLNGETKTIGDIAFPADDKYYTTLFGAFTDMERLSSGAIKGLTRLSRKPLSAPHIAYKGETLAYTPAYIDEELIIPSDGDTEVNSLEAPTSKEVTIDSEGLQSIGEQSVYALPAEEATNRQVFRFINSFGVLESISVPKVYTKKLVITSTPYYVSRQETFNTFSHSTIHKTNNKETWSFISDPLTEDWLYWYLHEFLMSEHIWLQINDKWVPCTIQPEEETTISDCTQQNMYSVTFSAKLDINGSPFVK